MYRASSARVGEMGRAKVAAGGGAIPKEGDGRLSR